MYIQGVRILVQQIYHGKIQVTVDAWQFDATNPIDVQDLRIFTLSNIQRKAQLEYV